MTRRTSSPEQSGRLYSNESYDDYPAASPLAMRAIRAVYLRRARLAESANQTLGIIDDLLGDHTANSSPTPPSERPKQRSPEEAPEPPVAQLRRKLGGTAMSYTPETKAA